MVEEELEMAHTWLYDQDLLDNPNCKQLSPQRAIHRFWAHFKCQFGDTVGKPIWCTFLKRLLLCEDKLSDVQIEISWVWDLKYHYCLDLTSAVPIWAKPLCLHPKEEALLDVHLDKLVAKGVIGPIWPGEQSRCVMPLLLILGIQSRQPYWVC